MKKFSATLLLYKKGIEPHQQLSGPIMAQLKKDVQERSFVVSRVGLSTSLARTESCTVEHISLFFNSLAAIRKEHPEISTEPGRLSFFDEKVELRC
jgi:hypothetical protein